MQCNVEEKQNELKQFLRGGILILFHYIGQGYGV